MGGKLRVVIIGAGEQANKVIYPSFAKLRGEGLVDIIGICDLNPEMLSETADKYQIANRYCGNDGYRKMAEELKPDAAAVIGQPHIMYDIWKWLLEQKINLLIEKPLGLTLHQARALEYLSARNKVTTQVCFQRRYTPMVQALRAEVVKRGEVSHAVCRFYKADPTDLLNARDHMMDDAVHSIDALRWITGSEIARIDSVTRRLGTVDINYIMAQMTFENGAVGHLMNNWTSGKRIFSVEMHSRGAFAEVEHEKKGYLYTDGSLEPAVYDAVECAGSSEAYIFTGVLSAIRDFVLCSLNGGLPMCNFTDAVKTMKAAEIILAQSLIAEG